MSISRRSILATASAGLASLEAAGAAVGSAASGPGLVNEQELVELVKRSADAHAALMRGDLNSYRA
jgi:uncharacterized protein YdbL (DUF1318 family)